MTISILIFHPQRRAGRFLSVLLPVLPLGSTWSSTSWEPCRLTLCDFAWSSSYTTTTAAVSLSRESTAYWDTVQVLRFSSGIGGTSKEPRRSTSPSLLFLPLVTFHDCQSPLLHSTFCIQSCTLRCGSKSFYERVLTRTLCAHSLSCEAHSLFWLVPKVFSFKTAPRDANTPRAPDRMWCIPPFTGRPTTSRSTPHLSC